MIDEFEIFLTYFIYNCSADGRRIFFFYNRKCEWNFGRINKIEFQHLPFFKKSKFFKSFRPSRVLCHTLMIPFFLFRMIQWRAAVITAKPFFLDPSQICYIPRISQYLVIKNLQYLHEIHIFHVKKHLLLIILMCGQKKSEIIAFFLPR